MGGKLSEGLTQATDLFLCPQVRTCTRSRRPLQTLEGTHGPGSVGVAGPGMQLEGTALVTSPGGDADISESRVVDGLSPAAHLQALLY